MYMIYIYIYRFRSYHAENTVLPLERPVNNMLCREEMAVFRLNDKKQIGYVNKMFFCVFLNIILRSVNC